MNISSNIWKLINSGMKIVYNQNSNILYFGNKLKSNSKRILLYIRMKYVGKLICCVLEIFVSKWNIK